MSRIELTPMNELHGRAKALGYRVAVTTDGMVGKGWLDTLDVWKGRPGKSGSELIAREPLLTQNVSAAARRILHQLK